MTANGFPLFRVEFIFHWLRIMKKKFKKQARTLSLPNVTKDEKFSSTNIQ